jgi:hypothetical protein
MMTVAIPTRSGFCPFRESEQEFKSTLCYARPSWSSK